MTTKKPIINKIAVAGVVSGGMMSSLPSDVMFVNPAMRRCDADNTWS